MRERLCKESRFSCLARALKICIIYIFNRNKLDLSIAFITTRGMFQEKALVDSRAIENFIDCKTIKQLRLGSKKLVTPINV